MDFTPEMLAMLEAQRAHFSSDDHIRREVEVWRDTTPEERLAELADIVRVVNTSCPSSTRQRSSA